MAIKKIENLNIHENPSTNTNQFDIENYLNSNFNKIKGAINNNADELEQAQNRIVELQNENTTLKNQIPRGEEVGNPIHISDSSDMECEIVPIGNAEQETRSGKNEFDKRLIESVINGTYENDILKNTPGQMNLQIVTSGITLSANTQYIVFKAKLESGTYSEGFSSIQCLDGNGFALTAVSNPSLSSEYKEYIFSKEITEGKTFKNILFQLFSNTNAVVLIKDIMITTSSDTTYEQYGASPSPDYPSPVKTVGQNINIFNEEFRQGNASGQASTNRLFSTQELKLKTGKTYTIFTDLDTTTYRYSINLNTQPFPTSISSFYDAGWKTVEKFTFTPTQDGYLGIPVSRIDNTDLALSDIDTFKFKIVEGTEVGGYSPYGQGSVEIEVCNKNEFDGIMEQGNISGTTGNNVTESACIRSKNYIKIRPSTSYFFEREGKLTDAVGLRFYDKDKNIISSATTNIGYGVKNKIFTTVANAYYMRFTDWTNDLTNKYLLAQSNVATDYIPHKSYTKVLPIQKEFVKIGDVEDTFIKQDGKWYEAHYHPKIVLDGTNINWYKAGVNTVDRYSTTDFRGKYGGKILCTHFKYANGTDEIGTMWLSSTSAQLYLNFAKYGTSTVADLNSWLAEQYANGTPVVIYYELAEPELIECTEEQSEILNSFYTYKNVTNISVDGIGTLKVNYKKDLETLFNNINSALLS